MIRNYFKMAYRHLWKNKLFSALNFIGLTIGLASMMTLLFGVYTYYSADSDLKGQENLYYLKTVPSNGESYMQTPYPLLEEIVHSSPNVKAATHIQEWYRPWLEFEGKQIQENTKFVDTGFFQVFTLPLKYGNPQTALRDKYSVVISEDISQRFFGNKNPIGKVLKADDSLNLTVTGVLAPISPYSTIQAEILLTSALLKQTPGFQDGADWYNTFAENYLRLAPSTNIPKFEAQIRQIAALNYNDDSNLEKIEAVPFSQLRNEYNPTAKTIMTGSIATAIFILIIVLVNLLNLNTSLMYARTKEVAVRKIIGSGKRSVVLQFCIENGILVFASLIVAGLLFVQVLQPQMNKIYEAKFGELSFAIARDYPLVLFYFGLGFIITLIVGILPSSRYISLPVTAAVKGKVNTSKSNFFVRNTFITIQFSLAIVFICVAIILNSQINFMQNAPLGFNEKNVAIVKLDLDYKDKKAAASYFKTILNQLKANPYVENVSTGQMIPFNYTNNYNTYYDPNTGKEVHFRHTGADAGYLKTFEIPLIAGRDFNEKLNASEENSVIINRKAMKALGWENLDNKRLVEKGGGDADTYNVIGVMENFHYQGLKGKIEPLLHWFGGKQQLGHNNFLSLRIAKGHKKQVLSVLKNEFELMPSKRDFEHGALAEKISTQYSLVEGILKTVNFVAFLTILISCLGMFGLISLIARQRVKEIGIRKVLGARAVAIVILLSKDFMKLVFIAALFAIPIAWIVMNKWLQDFAYRIDIEWWMFLLAGLIALFITVLTVGIHSVKAAIANPVESLRSE